MATIEKVLLKFDDDSPTPVAEVHYTIRASPLDVQQRIAYRELIELFGVDEGPGEDGQNERIPGGGAFRGASTFPNTVPVDRMQRFPLTSNALDEDPSTGPFPFPVEDEIRARVTLTPILPVQVVRNSNLVRRGAPENAPRT